MRYLMKIAKTKIVLTTNRAIIVFNILITMAIFSNICFAENVGKKQSAIKKGYETINCTIDEIKTIHTAFGILLDTVSIGFGAFQKCLSNAPLIEFSGSREQVSLTASEALKLNVLTKIHCYDAPKNVLAQARVSISGESMKVDRGFLRSYTNRAKAIAAVIAHEIMHNRGYRHKQNDFGSKYYLNTVPQQVLACVLTGNPNRSMGPKALTARLINNPTWVQANNNCLNACQSARYSPVISGSYQNKYDFYVCAHNLGNKGFRPGFNHKNEKRCSVGSGGDTHRSKNKYCLCNIPNINYRWVDAEQYDDCKATCIEDSLVPMATESYAGGGFFFICSVNAWKRGFRPGYNLQGTRKCVAGSGGDSVWRDLNKRCLCAE